MDFRRLLFLTLLAVFAAVTDLPAQDCNGNGVPDDDDVEVSFQTYVLTPDAPGAQAVTVADVDGDGDDDLVFAYGETVAWSRNTDGLGSFGAVEVVSLLPAKVTAILAADLDGDSDVDLISASDRVRLHENEDGGGSFGPAAALADDLDPTDLDAADIDGDSDLDLVVAFFDSDQILWFENWGPAAFAPGIPVHTAGGPWSVACDDLDADGDADIVAALRGAKSVVWFRNGSGIGDFEAPVTLAEDLLGSNHVEAADINGDGPLDILFSAEADDLLGWLPGSGAGSFDVPVTISDAVNGPREASSSDVDGDGDLDVIAASLFDDRVSWFENLDGSGAFGPLRPISADADGATAVAGSDLSGDGAIDVVSASAVDGKIRYHENLSLDCDGNGVPDECDIDQGASDCDADGVLDDCRIATRGPDCNRNGVLDDCDIASGGAVDACANGVPDSCEADCNGNGIPDPCDIGSGTSVDACENTIPDECEADCNADGMPDYCEVGDGVEDCVNGIPDACEPDCNGNSMPDICDTPDCNGNGVPDSCDLESGFETDCDDNGIPDSCDEPDCNGNAIPDSCDLESGFETDCDGNGIPDSCDGDDCDGNGVYDPCDIDAGTVPNCNDNDLPDACEIATWFTDETVTGFIDSPIVVVSADLDADSDFDVVVASFGSGRLVHYQNLDGDGTFGPEQEISDLIDEPESVVVADLDGDGDTDVLAAGQTLGWFENTGSGFADHVITFLDAADADAADVDGDGDRDVLAAFEQSGLIGWFENLGGLGFGSMKFVASKPGPQKVRAADLDGDGDTDVVASGWSFCCAPHYLTWYENLDGQGTFGAERWIDGCRVDSVVAGDLDGDGDADLLATCNAVQWYENLDGAGNFSAEFALGQLGDFRSALAGDLDGDGDLDVVAGSWFNGTVLWHENLDGQATYSPARSITSDLGKTGDVALGDLDGDGNLDVLGTAYVTDDVAWYRNERLDCNDDGQLDTCETSADPSIDCDGDLVPDVCQIATGVAGDCDGDGVPNHCDPDCNGNLTSDACDIVQGTSPDCDRNAVPDECDVPCAPGCDADGDDCFDPLDCDPDDPSVWAEPGPARDLRVAQDATTSLLSWTVPDSLGASSVRYDTLGSTAAADFVSAGFCVATDQPATVSDDPALPPSGGTTFYLIRVENDCPGVTGSMGADSSGAPRIGLLCP